MTAMGRPEHIRIPPNVRVSERCRQLLYQLLERDPRKRITQEQFFSHPFLGGISARSIYSVSTGDEFEVAISDDSRFVAPTRGHRHSVEPSATAATGSRPFPAVVVVLFDQLLYSLQRWLVEVGLVWP